MLPFIQILESIASDLPRFDLSIIEDKLGPLQRYHRQRSELPNSATIDELLSANYACLNCEITCLLALRYGFGELRRDGKISVDYYRERLNDVEKMETETRHEALTILLEDRILTEDIEDELKHSGAMHDAYAVSMMERLDIVTRKTKPLSINNVFAHYNAKGAEEKNGKVWCHILGWHTEDQVRVAHIVPKLLDDEVLSHAFGGRVAPANEVRNTLILNQHIKKKFDSGDLVILPVDGADDEWECVLTNKDFDNDVIAGPVLWKDIHRKRLRFRGRNRPAKRYLYFRFLITYLHQKWKNHTTPWTSVIESIGGRRLWPNSRDYLRKSTVYTLTHYVTGKDLSDTIFTGAFDGMDEPANDDIRQHLTERVILSLMKAVINCGMQSED